MKIIITILLLLFCINANATSYTWVGSATNTNWSVSTNWSPNGVPGSSDAVTVNNTAAYNLTVNATESCASLNCSGFTHTLTMSSSLSVGGSITWGSAMTITAGTTTLTMTGSGTLTSNGITFPNIFNVNSGLTLTLAGGSNWKVSAACTFQGTEVVNNTTSEQFEYASSSGKTFTWAACSGTATILISGTNCSLTGSSGIMSNNFTINSTGTVTFTSSTTSEFAGTVTYTAGTVVTTGHTLLIGTSVTLNTNGMSWNNITANGASTVVTLNSLLTAIGTFELNNATTGTFQFAGSYGFNVANWYDVLSGAGTIQLVHGVTYTITTSFIDTFHNYNSRLLWKSDLSGNQANLTLQNPSTCNVFFNNATDINSGAGRTITSLNSILNNTTNWMKYSDYVGTTGAAY